jgi:hypothetical protein
MVILCGFKRRKRVVWFKAHTVFSLFMS